MAFSLYFAHLDHCPPPDVVLAAMKEYGMPEGEEYAILSSFVSDNTVFATIARTTNTEVPRVDFEVGELESRGVEKATRIAFALFPDKKRLEVYEGAPSAVEHVAAMLGSCLALPTVVNHIELDIGNTVNHFMRTMQRVNIKSAKLKAYAASSYVEGPYSPKFLDNESAVEFLDANKDEVESVRVRFYSPYGLATVTIRPDACFKFSMKDEDGQSGMQNILRQAAGILKPVEKINKGTGEVTDA